MRVREYNIISHQKLPAYSPPERSHPVIKNDADFLLLRRTLSQNNFAQR